MARRLALSRHILRALVVAPHSDDEIIGAFGLTRRLLADGVRVNVVIVTDGTASHRNSPRWPRDRLAAERRRETQRALIRLGVPACAIRFLAAPDGGLDSLERERWNGLRRRLARGPDVELLIVPDAEDAHPDHRDVARLCAETFPPRIARLHYTVWRAADAAAAPASRRRILTVDPSAKRSCLRFYATQLGRIADDPRGFRLTPAHIAAMCGPVERFELDHPSRIDRSRR